MSKRATSNRGYEKKGPRLSTWLWVGGSALAIILLLYFEQTAILYVLATLGLSALLIVVALADLKRGPTTDQIPVPNDDAAAIGTGIGSTIPASATRARNLRPAKRG